MTDRPMDGALAAPTPSAARQHFSISRASEYFNVRELESMTGRPRADFAPRVVPKELIDNALDAAESAGRAPEVEIVAEFTVEGLRLRITDNGPGIAPDVVSRILDFETRTSDKAAYRAPARGAQGNALKTVLGIPCALGAERAEIGIESAGVQHHIAAWLDPAQAVRIDHTTTESTRTEGTAIDVLLPDRPFSDARLIRDLVLGYAALNPHASVRFRADGIFTLHGEFAPETIDDFYPASDPDWRKFGPTDPTSPHWYDAESFARLLQLTIHATEDQPIRAFVRQFKGLSGTAKAKAVCRELPWERLRELDGNSEAAALLLASMQRESTPPKPQTLGIIGEDHFRRFIAETFGIVGDRFWYRKATGPEPFVFEVAVAHVNTKGKHWVYGINFAPAFTDPFLGTAFDVENRGITGAVSILGACHADRYPHAVILNLTAPGLRFLDKGKSRLSIGDEMREAVERAMLSALKVFRDEGEKARRDARKVAREVERQTDQPEQMTLRAAIFAEMLTAAGLAAGGPGLPYNPRTMYYKMRPLAANHTTSELEYGYFTQTLIPDYEAKHGKLEGLYADPRGMFYEPHTGAERRVGDREVEAYQFPHWTFDKILFVEKKGLFPVLQAARLMERYDLAVIAGEGFASVAVRTLLARAQQKQKMRVFVLHDCDVDGYNIARTLGEETRRMPEHNIEVIDLGLRLEQARAMGLEVESYTRRKDIPNTLDLSDEEREFFIAGQTGRKQWSAHRVELNAMSSEQLIALIEDGLKEHEAAEKLVPPPSVLLGKATSHLDSVIEHAVSEAVARQLDVAEIVDRAYREVMTARPMRLRQRRIERTIEAAFQMESESRELPWGDVIERHVGRHMKSSNLRRDIEQAVSRAIRRQLSMKEVA
jgi:DNA topoisomerase VI subunit B